MEDIEITDDCTQKCWEQWADLVNSELWIADDHSVLAMTPHLSSTRVVLAKTKSGGDFVGAVVWNVNDNVAFLNFYILTPEARGKGIGSVLWQRAMKRIPDDHTIILVAVPEMAAKYQTWNTPIAGAHHYPYQLPWRTLQKMIREDCNVSPSVNVKLVSELSEESFEKLCRFDEKVTGRDRREFLRIFFSYEFTEGSVAMNDKGDILAYAAVSSTSLPSLHLFKLAPVYAPSLDLAAAVMDPLVHWVSQRDEEAVCMLLTLSGTKGEREMLPLFQKYNIERELSGISLYSKPYVNPIDSEMLFFAHDNSGHFDV